MHRKSVAKQKTTAKETDAMATSDDRIRAVATLNAIYIDFEGNQNKPPSLLGVRWRAAEMDDFAQFVFRGSIVPGGRWLTENGSTNGPTMVTTC